MRRKNKGKIPNKFPKNPRGFFLQRQFKKFRASKKRNALDLYTRLPSKLYFVIAA
jgi:hypothetical protein